MAGKPTKMSLVTEEEQARFRSTAKLIMLCESLERAHSPEKFSSNGPVGASSSPGRHRSAASSSSSLPATSTTAGVSPVCSPSKRRLLQAVDFASTGSHTVDLMKVNEVVDYRTTITKEKDYVERFVDAWKGGKPSMVACRFQMRKAQKSKVRSHQQHRVRSKSTSD